jgi:hypothetical protein
MRRLIGIVVTAWLLAAASTALAGESAPEKTPFVIEIRVADLRIDMGEKYAYAVPLGATITWTCEQPFAVQFEWNAPLDTVYRKGGKLQMTGRADAVPNHCYKYVVAVCKDGQVLTIDPVIIFYPPERDRQG